MATSIRLVVEQAGLIALRGSGVRRRPAEPGAVDQLHGHRRILIEELLGADRRRQAELVALGLDLQLGIAVGALLQEDRLHPVVAAFAILVPVPATERFPARPIAALSPGAD